jgi:selenide, water dikinase
VLGAIPRSDDDRVLIDFRSSDDAGVYRWESGPALVQTVDFFTPIVDDPFVYGQIAAANALSDVYAMGGRPLTALAIAAFPVDEPGAAVIQQIFLGGLDKLREAGVALLGGHTVRDQEIKFGYAVTGAVDPARILANTGARPGDVLLLTKPLGTGLIATALKFGRAPEQAVAAAVESMTALNRHAAEALAGAPPDSVHACTDITGFGLIGHASQMAAASGCTIRIDPHRVPLLDGALALGRKNLPGGGRTNESDFGPRVRGVAAVDSDLLAVLYDPQTSGGLFAAVAREKSVALVRDLEAAGVHAVEIGEVCPPAQDGALIQLCGIS